MNAGTIGFNIMLLGTICLSFLFRSINNRAIDQLGLALFTSFIPVEPNSPPKRYELLFRLFLKNSFIILAHSGSKSPPKTFIL